ncbi:helix-turn-helix domain-containing protein [Taibaiella soli]|uniref:HTH araC/xylS-type domain-containing protein n=1 Tax=Taibaiella soli TaxID=1649169 RepID=A0A2W2B3M9_9BACT|nr:AraC family transcriptional regulator [Taibaiella soli]PZF74914.1 hypothetical protein DN068_01580 [Taibaiella soli]
MINVFEPQSDLLKLFVDSIYVLKKDKGTLDLTAYPSVNTPVGLLRNAKVSTENQTVFIENATVQNYVAMVCGKFQGSMHVRYTQVVDEIAINFKPLGFVSFTQFKPQNDLLYYFDNWNEMLPALFESVFATADSQQQLEYIEHFLLTQYRPVNEESVLLKAIQLLSDTSKDYKIEEIANLVGVHYKQLYRAFTELIGCSPAHYRKLTKFRTSVVSKIQKGDNARLTDICYEQDYTDQPYFSRQFKELTGEKPTRFFKDITSFGNDKLIFKID